MSAPMPGCAACCCCGCCCCCSGAAARLADCQASSACCICCSSGPDTCCSCRCLGNSDVAGPPQPCGAAVGAVAACHAATACPKLRARCASTSRPGGKLAKLAAGSSPAPTATTPGKEAAWAERGSSCGHSSLVTGGSVHSGGGRAPFAAALPGRLAATTSWAHSAAPG